MRTPVVVRTLALVATLANGACADNGGVTETPRAPAPAASTISLAAAPAAVAVQQGQSGAVTVRLTRGGPASAVALGATVAGAPAGVTATLAPATVPADGAESVVTLATTAATPAGDYTVTLTGAAGGASAAATVVLRVAAAPAGHASANAYVVTGRVTNTDGAPVAGATVVANNQFYSSASVSGTSAADGTYRLALSDILGTWTVSASVDRTFDGTSYRLTLASDDAGPFAGPRGAVRDFVWRTRGPRPDGGYHGKPVVAYPPLEEGNFDMVMSDVELTLTPVAMLDGTAGQVITRHLVATAEGDAIVDVPIGRYTITAREVRAGEAPRPLQVRWRNRGDYVAAFTTGFTARYLDNALIELQVRR